MDGKRGEGKKENVGKEEKGRIGKEGKGNRKCDKREKKADGERG